MHFTLDFYVGRPGEFVSWQNICRRMSSKHVYIYDHIALINYIQGEFYDNKGVYYISTLMFMFSLAGRNHRKGFR